MKGKLLGNWGWGFMPWVSASVGVGFNRAYSFTNTPTIFEALPSSNFTSNTTTAFTYTLGIGIQRALTKHWQIGAGYEFSDWGKSELGRATGQTMGSGLSLSHLYTNAFLLNLTFVV
ncbi:MAG: outer membrane protein [Gammaproteobacteria bacterium]